MKLIIDVNDNLYESVKHNTNCCTLYEDLKDLYEDLKNGTPIAEVCDCIQREFALEPFEVFDDEEWISRDICKYLNSLPSVMSKQKVGQWIRVHHVSESRDCFDTFYCSNCQEEYSYDAETGVEITNYHICPNCGAKMNGGK